MHSVYIVALDRLCLIMTMNGGIMFSGCPYIRPILMNVISQ